MSIQRYPRKALLADYLRAAMGVLVPLALMIFTDLLPVVFYILLALALLFGIYGLRAALRQATVIIVDGDGVRQKGPLWGFFDRDIRWSDMRDFRLRYYSTRRDGKEGWMQLILRGAGGRNGSGDLEGSPARGGAIRMDSSLPGFEDIVRQAHAMSLEHGLVTDPTTANNLSASGLGADDQPPSSMDAKLPS